MKNLSDLFKGIEGVNLLKDEDDLPIQGYFDTGSYAMNKAVGGTYNSGYAIGGIIEIMGDSSTGKTAFITQAFAEAQKKGYYCVIVDNEFTYSPLFAKNFGVDPEKVVYTAPISIAECFDTIEKIIKAIREEDKDTPILIGYDSIAGASKAEMEKESYKDFSMTDGAIRAQETGKCLRKINPILSKNKATLLVINQIRSKVGVMYGSPDTRSGGGRALEFYCKTCIKTSVSKSKGRLLDDFDRPIGITGTIKCEKNKVATPFQEAEFKLLFDKGLDRVAGLLPSLVADKVVLQAGAWYTIGANGVKFQSANFDANYLDLSNKDFEVLREHVKNN